MNIQQLEIILEPVFKRWKVTLPTHDWQPKPNTDDFGQGITSILLAAEIDEKVSSPLKSMMAGKIIWDGITFKHTPRNLKALSEKLGFSIQEASSFYYIRDIFLRLADNSISYCANSPHLKEAIDRVHSSNLYLDKGATTRTRNQLFNHWTGYAGNYYSQSMHDLQTYFPNQFHPFSDTYLEGGNVFRLTNKNGEEVVLAGEDHLPQSLLLLELEGRDWETLAKKAEIGSSFQEQVEKHAVKLSPEAITKYAEEMFSLGLRTYKDKTGLIAQNDQLNILLAKFFMPSEGGRAITENEHGWFRKLAAGSGIVDSFQLSPEQIEMYRLPVAGYLTKLEITRALMAIDCRVDKKNLHFISQANYHLDAFLHPAPHHALFIVDYAIAADILEAIRQSDLFIKLPEGDQTILDGYLQTAKKFNIELNSILKLVQSQLIDAGFDVIPMPGHFLYEPGRMYEQFPMPSDGLCINFTNALSGYSNPLQAPFYITHGVQAGEQVGSMLMDAFSLFLRQYSPEILTFFIGYDPDHPNDFTEALDFWNRLETQSGIHCMTFPLSWVDGSGRSGHDQVKMSLM